MGYQFSPRLADIGGTRFWRVDGKADYGALDGLASQRINIALIVQHWEDLLRLAGSLKLGTVQAMGLIRTLQTKDRPTKLARALKELGRLIKTLYLLRFIDDEAYRRRILVQLNRGEGRHQLARIVFHGKRGELRHRYREGQEDQLGALGLVVNVIVLWNTIYMDVVLNQLRAEGFDVRDEDVARLSLLGFDHINMLGRYAFVLPDQIARMNSGRCATLKIPTTRAESNFRFRCYRTPKQRWRQLRRNRNHPSSPTLHESGPTSLPRPWHVQRRRTPAQRRMVRHAQAEAEQADDGAEQPLGVARQH